MTGHIPDPDKNLLDYMNKIQQNRFHIPFGIVKILIGVLTFVIIPLSIFVYTVLLIFSRRFMFSSVPELCDEVVRYSINMFNSGWKDIFQRFYN